MALAIPQGVPSNGAIKVIWTPVLADPNAPSLTELTGASAVDLTCYLMGDGFGTDAAQETSTGRRLCSKQVYTISGTVNWTLNDFRYVYDTQEPEGVTHEAYAALIPDTTGYIVVRWAADAEQELAAGDVVDVFNVTMGPRRKQTPEENSELTVLQTAVVSGSYHEDVALVAA